MDYNANYNANYAPNYAPNDYYCHGYSVRYLPFIGRALASKRGSEEFIFRTREEAVAFWRKIRHERRGERLELLQVGPRYSRYTLATWDPKPGRRHRGRWRD